MNYQSSFNESSFTGSYANVDTLTISDAITIGLTTINDEEVSTERTMGIPNSGTDGQFVITNGDVDQIIGGNNTFTGMNTFEQTTTFETDIKVDNINEYTLDHGVNIESMTVDGNILYLDGKANGKQYIQSSTGVTGMEIINSDDNPINIENTGNNGSSGGIILQTDNSDIIIRTHDLFGNDTSINFQTSNNGVVQMDTLRLEVDTIDEFTLNNGVHVEGVTMKDSDVTCDVVNANTGNLTDIYCDYIHQKNPGIGLNVADDLHCEGEIYIEPLGATPGPLKVLTGSGLVYQDLITNADIVAAAGIPYSKLSLGNSVQGSDIKTTTNITCNDLYATNNLQCDGIFTANEINTDINTINQLYVNTGAQMLFMGTGVVKSNVSGVLSSSTIVNADVSGSAAIAYSKLNLANSVTNADLAGSIADTKLLTISTAGKVSNSATTATDANTASAIVARDASGNFSCGTVTASGNLSASNGFVRANEGAAFGLQWANSGVGNLSSFYSTNRNTFIFQMNGATLYTFTNTGLTTSPYITAGVLKSTVTTGAITTATIVNADVSATAAIALSKLASGTSAQIIVANGTGVPTYVAMTGNVTITNAGVTAIASNVITNAMINSAAAIADTKLATISTAGKVSNSATTATNLNTASAIVARDASGNFTASQGRFTSLSLNAGTNSITGIFAQGGYTATITDAAGVEPTYLTRSCNFHRLGTFVRCSGYIQINTKTGMTGTDEIRISVPYPVAGYGAVGNFWFGSGSMTVPAGTIIGTSTNAIVGTSYLKLGWQLTTGRVYSKVSELNVSGFLEYSICYEST